MSNRILSSMTGKGAAKKVCFVALSAYPLLSGKPLGFVGGSEKRFALLGKELAGLGFQVSFITYGDGGSPLETAGSLSIIKVYRRERVNKLSLLHKSLSIFSALKKANADFYIVTPEISSISSIFSRIFRKKTFVCIASDKDVRRKNSGPKLAGNGLSRKVGLHLADAVIAQTEFQRSLVKEHIRRDSTVIKNPVVISPVQETRKTTPPVALWVGTIRPVKQPELLIQLAKAIPASRFQMIGGASPGEESYYETIRDATRPVPNLEFLGMVPPGKMKDYYAKASILINTSAYEGFPNTFLEAWMANMPVVSLNVDPDEIICHHQLGFHSQTMDRLITDVTALLRDAELIKQMGNNGRAYAQQEHDIRLIGEKYAEILGKSKY